MGAARRRLPGALFVSSGLGGMSGAQGKAVEIAGGVAIVAEVDPSRIRIRRDQGWVRRVVDDPAAAFGLARDGQTRKAPMAIAFHGNVVDLLQYAVDNDEVIDLLSDQASCHVAYDVGKNGRDTLDGFIWPSTTWCGGARSGR